MFFFSFLRTLVFSILNCSSSQCGFESSSDPMRDKPSSAFCWSVGFSRGSLVFFPPYLDLAQNERNDLDRIKYTSDWPLNYWPEISDFWKAFLDTCSLLLHAVINTISCTFLAWQKYSIKSFPRHLHYMKNLTCKILRVKSGKCTCKNMLVFTLKTMVEFYAELHVKFYV